MSYKEWKEIFEYYSTFIERYPLLDRTIVDERDIIVKYLINQFPEYLSRYLKEIAI